MNITFVLAVYNKLELTKECYRHLRYIYPTAPLVISSGGSSDGTKEWLESLEDENVSYIKHFFIVRTKNHMTLI
jgi:GT2 family glycosyltransferase